MAETTRYCKALFLGIKAQENGEQAFRFRATTDALDRQGEVVTTDGWQTDAFLRNPVFLLAHDYRSLPIGKVVALTQDADGLLADVVFDDQDEQARAVRSKYERGFLNAVSVGFNPIEIEYPDHRNPKAEPQPLRHTRKELLEISAVAIPANPDALMLRALGLTLPERQMAKRAMPPHTTPKAAEAAEWNASGEVAAADVSDLRAMCAWVDADNEDLKSAYKLPHHRAGGGHEVVWRGVAAAMAALLGARGGVAIPDEDRRAVYAHLSRHYRQFDKEPPEWKTLAELAKLGPEEIRGLFWEDEVSDEQEGQEGRQAQGQGRQEAATAAATKAGRRNSKADLARMQRVMDLLRDVMSAMQDIMGDMGDDGADAQDDQDKTIDADLNALFAFAGQKGAAA